MNADVNKLRAISRFEMDDESTKVLRDIFKDKFITITDCNEIFMHRIQFLLLRHALNDPELKLEKMLGRQLSAELVFLQKKYEEFLMYISKLVKALNEKRIPYSLLKGFSIINSLYSSNNVIYRDFGDVDVLINKNDLDAIIPILTEIGFIQGYLDREYKVQKADRKEIIYWRLNSHQEQTFIKPSKYADISPILVCRVDLNTTIFEGGKLALPISTEDLLKETRLHNINDSLQIRSLCYELELIQLCYHLYKDISFKGENVFFGDYTLIKFCDIREYIRKYREAIDWDKFLYYINTCDIGRAIYISLLLVSTFYGDLEMDEVLAKIKAEKSDITVPEWEEVLI